MQGLPPVKTCRWRAARAASRRSASFMGRHRATGVCHRAPPRSFGTEACTPSSGFRSSTCMLADATRWGGGGGGRAGGGAGGGRRRATPAAAGRPAGGRPGRASAGGLAGGPGGGEGGVAAAAGRPARRGCRARPGAPSVDHGDRSARSDGRQAVGDDDRRAALHQPLERAARPAPRCRGRGWTSPRRAPAPPGRPARRGPATRAASRPPTGASPARGPRCRARREARRSARSTPIAASAASTSSSVAPARARRTLSRIVPLNRKPSCGHDDDALAQRGQRGVAQVDAAEADRAARSGRRGGRCSLASVDLPAPVGPDERQPLAGGDRAASTSLQHRPVAAGVGERRRRRPRCRPRPGRSTAPGRSATSGSVSSSSNSLFSAGARRLHAC